MSRFSLNKTFTPYNAEKEAERYACLVICDAILKNGVKIEPRKNVKSADNRIFDRTDYIIPGADFYLTYVKNTNVIDTDLAGRYVYSLNATIPQILRVKSNATQSAVIDIMNNKHIKHLLKIAEQHQLEK